jgi:hypothetical protein
MAEIILGLATGRRVAFQVQEGGPECAWGPHFLLGVRKSGSSVLNNICQALARLNQRSFVPVGDIFFAANVVSGDWLGDPALRGLIRGGNIYGGFRDMPLALQGMPAFDAAAKILMVRDPRDALVSEYFSNAYSHSIPETTGSADAVTAQMLAKRQQALAQEVSGFVLGAAPAMNTTMQQYAPLLRDPRTLMLKYEDMVFDKATLIGHLCRQFGLQARPAQVAQILGWADKRPDTENPRAFVRKVTPGDHRAKLDTGTIARLNTVLAPSMALFGYHA